jgi:hypothetical protein
MIINKALQKIGYEAEVGIFMDEDGLFEYLVKIELFQYPSLIVLDDSLPKLEASDVLSIFKAIPSFKNSKTSSYN